MKGILFIFAFVSLAAFGQSEAGNESRLIKGHRFDACDYWETITSDYTRVYGCGFRPQRVIVADAADTTRELEAAKALIEDLQRRVTALEHRINQLTN